MPLYIGLKGWSGIYLRSNEPSLLAVPLVQHGIFIAMKMVWEKSLLGKRCEKSYFFSWFPTISNLLVSEQYSQNAFRNLDEKLKPSVRVNDLNLSHYKRAPGRGVLFPLLFPMMTELLAVIIRGEPDIKGFVIDFHSKYNFILCHQCLTIMHLFQHCQMLLLLTSLYPSLSQLLSCHPFIFCQPLSLPYITPLLYNLPPIQYYCPILLCDPIPFAIELNSFNSNSSYPMFSWPSPSS